jgi:hypothetical protein
VGRPGGHGGALVATWAGPSQTNANPTVVANKYIVIHLSLGSPLESPFCFVMTFITRFGRTVKQNPLVMFWSSYLEICSCHAVAALGPQVPC